jgi:hypothetical protein
MAALAVSIGGAPEAPFGSAFEKSAEQGADIGTEELTQVANIPASYWRPSVVSWQYRSGWL